MSLVSVCEIDHNLRGLFWPGESDIMGNTLQDSPARIAVFADNERETNLIRPARLANYQLLPRAAAALGVFALLLAGMLLGVVWRRGQPPPRAPQLSVVFLNVGAGACTLVQTPSGQTVLIDTGSASASSTLKVALRQFGVHSIDLLVLTAPEETSIGGVPALLAGGLPVAQVWDSPTEDVGPARRAALEAIRRRHIPSRTVQGGSKVQVGDRFILSALWPPEDNEEAGQDPLVCRIDYGKTSFVLEGSSESQAENALASEVGSALGSQLQSSDTVLQVAARQPGVGASPELLRRVTPAIVVISCGPSSAPTLGMLHRLQAAGAEVWRTDTQGTVLVTTDGRVPPTVAPLSLERP